MTFGLKNNNVWLCSHYVLRFLYRHLKRHNETSKSFIHLYKQMPILHFRGCLLYSEYTIYIHQHQDYTNFVRIIYGNIKFCFFSCIFLPLSHLFWQPRFPVPCLGLSAGPHAREDNLQEQVWCLKGSGEKERGMGNLRWQPGFKKVINVCTCRGCVLGERSLNSLQEQLEPWCDSGWGGRDKNNGMLLST